MKETSSQQKRLRPELIDNAAMRGVASAILLQAIVDFRALKRGDVKETRTNNFRELKKFFSSAWFEELCEMGDYKKSKVLKALESTQKITLNQISSKG